MNGRPVQLVIALWVMSVAMTGSATAQTASRNGRLVVTVTDPNGGVVSGATVTVSGLDDTTKSGVIKPEKTADRGTATIESLLPGRYSVRAEAAGLEPNALKDIRIRPGENKHVIVLALKKIEESVTVSTDAQLAASD